MNILERIAADTKKALFDIKNAVPLSELKRLASGQTAPLDFAAALKGEQVKIIAEIKRASPSCGSIRPDCSPAETAVIYAGNGASAISVLTEPAYFKGSLDDLAAVKSALKGHTLPVLRKDFLLEPYQVYQSRAYGADCILLIAALLDANLLQELLHLSRELGMSSLVEVHNEDELACALEAGAEIIGINNRDLTTFYVDLAVTQRLCPLIPAELIKVSESGIKSRQDIEKMHVLGINAVLVGELLMRAPNIAAQLKELI